MLMNKSNCQAYGVLAALVYKLNEQDLNKLYVEGHCNGREQGFAIQLNGTSKKVSFAQQRRTDSIVVYYGNSTDFSMQGNGPCNDDVYHHQKEIFGEFDFDEAAKFIKEFFGL